MDNCLSLIWNEVGPWSSGQRTRRLLRRSEFESRCSQAYRCVSEMNESKKSGRGGRFYKIRKVPRLQSRLAQGTSLIPMLVVVNTYAVQMIMKIQILQSQKDEKLSHMIKICFWKMWRSAENNFVIIFKLFINIFNFKLKLIWFVQTWKVHFWLNYEDCQVQQIEKSN